MLSQACLSKRTWNLAVHVMDMFEQSKLKGQKLKLSNLLQKPEFKQNYLAPIRTLSETEQCNLLSEVISKEILLSDLQRRSNQIKQEKALKNAFVRMTNVGAWEEALQKYPQFTTKDQLERFMTVDMKKSVPKSFSDFCQRAMISECELSDTASTPSSLTINGTTAIVVELSPLDISGTLLKSCPSIHRGQPYSHEF